jgi:acyl-coenzyme A thioesterase PaaI-like protein
MISSAAPDSDAQEAAVASLRKVIAHLRKTKAPAELLRESARELDAIAQRLAPHDHSGPWAQSALDFEADGFNPSDDPSQVFPYSPVVGHRNPIAPPIRFELRDGELHAEHAFDAPWSGAPNAVHGGIIALVFDELLGSVNVVNGLGAFTGTLTLVYRALTPAETPIRMRGWIDRTEGRKVFARGTMHAGEVLCAEAEGTFIAPKAFEFSRRA